MLVVYKAIRGELRLTGTPESTEKVTISNIAVGVGDLVDMGGSRPWQVVKAEVYQSTNDQVVLAAVSPKQIPVPPESEWTGFYWPNYPNRTFAIALTSDSTIITTESRMDGQPMSGQVDIATTSATGAAKLDLTDWVVAQTVTYQPVTQPSAYAGIHLCYCYLLNKVAA